MVFHPPHFSPLYPLHYVLGEENTMAKVGLVDGQL